MVKKAPTETKEPRKKPSKEEKEEDAKKKEIMKKMLEIVKDYASSVRDKFGKYVKAIIMFGPAQAKEFTEVSKIDVMIVVDDTAIGQAITPEFREALQNQLTGLAGQKNKRLHIQMSLLTEFWNFLRQGDPVFFNYLRNGIPVLDLGFFEPLKRLLFMGAIRSTKEAIIRSMEASRDYLNKIKTYWEWSIERMFRAVTWSCNAYLMANSMPPADPKEMAGVLEHYFFEQGKLEEEYPKTIAEIVKTYKDIEHGVAGEIKPELVIDLEKKTKKFVERMDAGVKEMMKGAGVSIVAKDRIATTPKIFWVYKNGSRGYCWLFEDSIITAIYEEKEGTMPKLKTVMKAGVKEKELSEFTGIEQKELMEKLEQSQFKPIITPTLIQIVLKHLPPEYSKEIVRLGVEYPGRALLDLTTVMTPPQVPQK